MVSRRYRDELKMLKVIASCQTLEQCATAYRFIKNYDRYYASFSSDTRAKLQTKQRRIAGVPK